MFLLRYPLANFSLIYIEHCFSKDNQRLVQSLFQAFYLLKTYWKRDMKAKGTDIIPQVNINSLSLRIFSVLVFLSFVPGKFIYTIIIGTHRYIHYLIYMYLCYGSCMFFYCGCIFK